MKTVNVHQAKTHLSRLLEEVASGEEIVIAKGGKPIAKLVHLAELTEPRKPGLYKGKIKIHDDFDAPLPPDIARGFGIE